MKKILFIVFEIDSASGICVSNVAEQMVKMGWKVDILSYPTKRKIDSRISKYEIRPEFFRYMYERFHHISLLSNIFSFGYKGKIAMTTFMWPWNSPILTLRLLNKAYYLYNLNKYDCIVPVYTQVDPIIVGHLIKRKYGKKVNEVPYFLDSLSAGPVPRLLSKNNKIKKGLKWEERLLSNADGIIYMESSKTHHMKYSVKKKYFENVVFLDIPALRLEQNIIDCQEQNTLKKYNRCINITYVGSLANGIRNPEYAFKTLSQLKNLNIHINIVGVSEEEAKRFRTFNLEINWVGKVSHEEAIKYLISADVLLNIGNQIEGMVPSKIFEYMSYAKPIISFSPIDNEPSLEYLKRYSKSCILKEWEPIETNEHKIREFLQTMNDVNISSEEIKFKFYKNTPECFCNYINRLIKEKADEISREGR